MWLAMKLGVSFATTVPFPSRSSAKRLTADTTAGSVSGVGTISSKRRYRGGLKKCVPSQWRRKSSERPSARAAIGSPDVFVLTMEPGRRSRVHARQQIPFGIGPLDHRLDDPVRIRDLREVLIEVSDRDEPGAVWREERIRPERARPLEPLSRHLWREVEQQARYTGVGEMRGYLGAHRAGAEHRHRPESHHFHRVRMASRSNSDTPSTTSSAHTINRAPDHDDDHQRRQPDDAAELHDEDAGDRQDQQRAELLRRPRIVHA